MFTDEEENEAKEFMKMVVSNPVTGRITMFGSAVRFQSAMMKLTDDYKKKGIKEVPVSLIEDFIMQSTMQAIDEDVVEKVDEVEKIFKVLEKLKNDKN